MQILYQNIPYKVNSTLTYSPLGTWGQTPRKLGDSPHKSWGQSPLKLLLSLLIFVAKQSKPLWGLSPNNNHYGVCPPISYLILADAGMTLLRTRMSSAPLTLSTSFASPGFARYASSARQNDAQYSPSFA